MSVYVEQFQTAAPARTGEPAWLRERRELAIERFGVLGFPTTRDEEYKYTNLAKLAKAPMTAAPAFDGAVGEDALAKASYAGLEGARIVFVDGRLHAGLSRLTGLPQGAVVASIAETLATNPATLEGHLTRYADIESHATTALNTALFVDGAVISVPAKVRVEEPVHVIWLSSGEANRATHPRTLILAGRESDVKVIESFIALRDGSYWTNAVTEIVAEEAARVEHFKAQQESLEAFHTGTIEMLEERNGFVSTISLSFGGAMTRNDFRIKLNDENSECALDGLYVVSGKQHVDHHTVIDHAMPHCNSHQLYKGVLGGESRGVFNGKIIVRKDAQKTDAIQNNKNLLLSKKAEIDTKPQLEIDANDVRCTHGATIGQLDADAVFYLQSRGIGKDQARSLLTYAFAADLLERISVEPLKNHFEEMLLQALGKEDQA